MKRLALALVAATLFATATPASAQYVYMDDGYYGNRSWWGGGSSYNWGGGYSVPTYSYRMAPRTGYVVRRYDYEPEVYVNRSWWGGGGGYPHRSWWGGY
jgi:hypothetical protein